jgi:hypothetical protein
MRSPVFGFYVRRRENGILEDDSLPSVDIAEIARKQDRGGEIPF